MLVHGKLDQVITRGIQFQQVALLIHLHGAILSNCRLISLVCTTLNVLCPKLDGVWWKIKYFILGFLIYLGVLIGLRFYCPIVPHIFYY